MQLQTGQNAHAGFDVEPDKYKLALATVCSAVSLNKVWVMEGLQGNLEKITVEEEIKKWVRIMNATLYVCCCYAIIWHSTGTLPIKHKLLYQL